MKILPSIAFNDFSGSAGNVTARKVGDKTYLSSRTKHARTKTPSQATVRCRFADTTRGYANITEDQRQGWISLARRLGNYFTSSGYTTMTGHNLFVSINMYRKLCGKPLIADAPPEIKPSRYIHYEDLWVSPEHIVFTGVGMRESPSEVLLIEVYLAPSPSIMNAWNNTTILTICPTTDWGDIDITEAFIKKYGKPLTIKQKLYIKLCWLDSECGYLARYTQIALLAKERSDNKGLLYTPRAQLTIKDIDPVTENSECEALDYELSPIYKMTSNSITIRHISGYFTSYKFPHSGLTYQFNIDRSFQYGRATETQDLTILYVEVLVQNDTQKIVFFNKLAAASVTHFVTFGTYFVKS